MAASTDVLRTRALNRALLERQSLLTRAAAPALDMVERLVGMQAQVPDNPYVALWSRVQDFATDELSGLLDGRAAVRAQLMRATIHLVSARDCLALQPVTLPVLARAFNSPWAARLHGAPLHDVLAAGQELLAEAPHTRAQLAELLAPRWPAADPAALAHAVTFHSGLVQVPPRGLWGRAGQATWAPTETWLDATPDDAAPPAPDAAVLRYLAAFGPATVADARTWSGLAGLREVFERLRPQLRTFRDERGRELFDVPGAPLPDPGTPAPPRFLPEFDNVLLSHADRSRVLAAHSPRTPLPRGRWIGTLLVDGFHRANWRVTDRDGAATLTVEGLSPLPGDPGAPFEEVEAEGQPLLAFLAPGSEARPVVFAPGRQAGATAR